MLVRSGVDDGSGDGSSSEETVESSNVDDMVVGMRVVVDGKNRGILRFVGETQFAGGTWLGIELHEARGKNNGSVHGVRYFNTTRRKHTGLFVRADSNRVTKLRPSISVGDLASSALSGEWDPSAFSHLVETNKPAQAAPSRPPKKRGRPPVAHAKARRELAADAGLRTQGVKSGNISRHRIEDLARSLAEGEVSTQDLFLQIVELEEAIQALKEDAIVGDAQRNALLWRMVDVADHGLSESQSGLKHSPSSSVLGSSRGGEDVMAGEGGGMEKEGNMNDDAVTPREQHLMRVIMILKEQVEDARDRVRSALKEARGARRKSGDLERMLNEARSKYIALLEEHEAVMAVTRKARNLGTDQQLRLVTSLQRSLSRAESGRKEAERECAEARARAKEEMRSLRMASQAVPFSRAVRDLDAELSMDELRDKVDELTVADQNREVVLAEYRLKAQMMADERDLAQARNAALFILLRDRISDVELVEMGILDVSTLALLPSWDPRKSATLIPSNLDQETFRLDQALPSRRVDESGNEVEAEAEAEGDGKEVEVGVGVDLPIVASIRNEALTSQLIAIDRAKHRSVSSKTSVRTESWQAPI